MRISVSLHLTFAFHYTMSNTAQSTASSMLLRVPPTTAASGMRERSGMMNSKIPASHRR